MTHYPDDIETLIQEEDLTDIIEELGLTAETEELIQDHAHELLDDIANFDEDVQIEIIENL